MSDGVSGQAGAAGDSPSDASCHEPAAGVFVLRGETGCLSRGDTTMVFGTSAYETQLLTNCESPSAQWELTPSVVGSFTLRNVETKLMLDVRAGSDLPGTKVILYDANMLDNQRFWLRPRTPDAYELSPRNAPGLCVEARDSGLEIWSCQPETSGQDFRLVRRGCP